MDESRPPAAFETHAADLYDLLPLPMEDCTSVELPGGSGPSHLCILRIGPHHVEIAPGGHRTLGVLDEPPIVGRADPAAAFLDEGGRLRPPSIWRGQPVTSVDDGWTVLGPIQPIGDGVVLRNPSPQRLRQTCDRVAGRRLHDDVHAGIRRTVLDGQPRPMTVSTPEAVE
ncbi:hypothetical protein [Sphingomonas panni]|uniref:hypothetical protein n=1 Tax=Sphingomonas panni TaxID=237612 RepID=UPI001F5B5D19|nr:hypothetical protein [Sphingomonas panni]